MPQFSNLFTYEALDDIDTNMKPCGCYRRVILLVDFSSTLLSNSFLNHIWVDFATGNIEVGNDIYQVYGAEVMLRPPSPRPLPAKPEDETDAYASWGRSFA